MTQADRVLAASRELRGTCQADWLGNFTPDGGPIITRVAARIQDLEGRGCIFESIGERHGTKVYRLVFEPAVQRTTGGQPRPPLAGDGAGPTPRVPACGSLDSGRLFTPEPEPHWRAA